MSNQAKFAAEPALVAPHYRGVALDISRQRDPDWSHSLEMAAVFGVTFGIERDREYAFADGVAFLPVRGTLINRCGYSWGGWITGYKYLLQMASQIVADGDVKGVVFDIDGYGGEAAGCFETARSLREMFRGAGIKTMAMIDSNALSATYAIACSADQVVAIPSGRVGSIGAIMMHWDESAANTMEGEKVTIFAAGSHKADGNPFQPLSPEAAAAFQARIDTCSANFCAFVAEMRGADAAAITALQADSFAAPDALAHGLVDVVATAPEAFAGFLDSLCQVEEDDESTTVTLEATQMADPTADAGAERARVKAILSAPEATGRTDLANYLAFDTSMSAADAVVMLSKAPAPAAATPAAAPAPAATVVNPLAAAMQATGGGANVGQDAGAPGGEVDPYAAAAELMTKLMVANGRRGVTQ